MTQEVGIRLYRARWGVLGAFMLVVIVNQLSWITFAAITSQAAAYYGVSELEIGLLSLSFMLVYLIVSIPASWAIDTYGFRRAVGLGAVLTAVFGMARGLVGPSYTLVLLAQLGIAVGQPFILNAVTKVAGRWFGPEERATASGLGTLAIFVGVLLGVALTPVLTASFGIASMLLIYGVAAIVVAVVFFAVAGERPPTPPGPPGEDIRALVFDGMRQMLRRPDFLRLLAVFFIGLGVFNSVTTWIEDILRPRGFSPLQAGMIGGVMVAAGIVGALVLPALSDRRRRRTPYLVVGMAGACLGLAGLTFAPGFAGVMVASLVLGFFLLGAAPVGFQYGAEATLPAPEATSNGLLLMMGQISGIAFILAMDAFRAPETGSMTPSLVVLTVLMGVSFVLCLGLKEAAPVLPAKG